MSLAPANQVTEAKARKKFKAITKNKIFGECRFSHSEIMKLPDGRYAFGLLATMDQKQLVLAVSAPFRKADGQLLAHVSDEGSSEEGEAAAAQEAAAQEAAQRRRAEEAERQAAARRRAQAERDEEASPVAKSFSGGAADNDGFGDGIVGEDDECALRAPGNARPTPPRRVADEPPDEP